MNQDVGTMIRLIILLIMVTHMLMNIGVLLSLISDCEWLMMTDDG